MNLMCWQPQEDRSQSPSKKPCSGQVQGHPGSCPQHCSPCLPHFGRDSNQKLRPLNSIGIYNGIFQVQHVTFKMLFFEDWVPIQSSIFLKLVTPPQCIRKTASESLFLDSRNVGAVTLLEHWPCVCKSGAVSVGNMWVETDECPKQSLTKSQDFTPQPNLRIIGIVITCSDATPCRS